MKKSSFAIFAIFLSACASNHSRTPSSEVPSLTKAQKAAIKDSMKTFGRLFENLEDVDVKLRSGPLHLNLAPNPEADRMSEMMKDCKVEGNFYDISEEDYFSSGTTNVKYSLDKNCPFQFSSSQTIKIKDERPNGTYSYAGKASFEITEPKFLKLSYLRSGSLVASGASSHTQEKSNAYANTRGKFESIIYGPVTFNGSAKFSVEGGKTWQERRKGQGHAEATFNYRDFSVNFRVEVDGASAENLDYPDYKKSFKYFVNGREISREALISEYLPESMSIDEHWPATSFHDGLKHFHNPWLHR